MKHLTLTLATVFGFAGSANASYHLVSDLEEGTYNLSVNSIKGSDATEITYTGNSFIIGGIEYFDTTDDENTVLSVDPYPVTSFDLSDYKNGVTPNPVDPDTGLYLKPADDPLYQPVAPIVKNFFVSGCYTYRHTATSNEREACNISRPHEQSDSERISVTDLGTVTFDAPPELLGLDGAGIPIRLFSVAFDGNVDFVFSGPDSPDDPSGPRPDSLGYLESEIAYAYQPPGVSDTAYFDSYGPIYSEDFAPIAGEIELEIRYTYGTECLGTCDYYDINDYQFHFSFYPEIRQPALAQQLAPIPLPGSGLLLGCALLLMGTRRIKQ